MVFDLVKFRLCLLSSVVAKLRRLLIHDASDSDLFLALRKKRFLMKLKVCKRANTEVKRKGGVQTGGGRGQAVCEEVWGRGDPRLFTA